MRAESASLIVPVYSSVHCQPSYEIHLQVKHCIGVFSWSLQDKNLKCQIVHSCICLIKIHESWWNLQFIFIFRQRSGLSILTHFPVCYTVVLVWQYWHRCFLYYSRLAIQWLAILTSCLCWLQYWNSCPNVQDPDVKPEPYNNQDPVGNNDQAAWPGPGWQIGHSCLYDQDLDCNIDSSAHMCTVLYAIFTRLPRSSGRISKIDLIVFVARIWLPVSPLRCLPGSTGATQSGQLRS